MITRRTDITPLAGLVLSALLAAPILLRAQEPAGERYCREGEVEGSLGITGISCEGCTLWTSDEPGGPRWRFTIEPRIRGVETGGPADGLLRSGDVLVAVDGHLITTEAGGRRLADPVPGSTVDVRFRRDGRVRSVPIRVESRCRSRVPPSPPREAIAEPPAPPSPTAIRPWGRLGFSFRCSDCGYQSGSEGETGTWFFESPPEIYRVDPEGPAGQAGLRNGDALTHIDGTDLTTPEGGRRFALIAAGDTVRWTVRRGSRDVPIAVVAGSREPAPVAEAGEAGPEATPVPEAERPAPGAAPAPEAAGPEVAPAEPTSPLAARLRYAGTLEGAEVEVRGEPVSVMEDREAGLLIIRSEKLVVRIRVAKEAPPED